jgi:hypothetical protein
MRWRADLELDAPAIAIVLPLTVTLCGPISTR